MGHGLDLGWDIKAVMVRAWTAQMSVCVDIMPQLELFDILGAGSSMFVPGGSATRCVVSAHLGGYGAVVGAGHRSVILLLNIHYVNIHFGIEYYYLFNGPRGLTSPRHHRIWSGISWSSGP